MFNFFRSLWHFFFGKAPVLKSETVFVPVKNPLSHASYLRRRIAQADGVGRKGRWLDGSNLQCKRQVRALQGYADKLKFALENEIIKENIARREA